MKKYGKIAAALAAIMISAGTTGIYAMANNNDPKDSAPAEKKSGEDVSESDTKESGSDAAAKNETVYVMTDASGKKTKTIVSDWLKNYGGNDKITDFSDLTDIENLKFDGGFKADGSDITWSADGGDIYYKGYSNDELPVDIRISYKLNGRSVSPDDLAGKSGRVTIRYDYTNNSKKTVKVNGQDTVMYTPFMMATGVLLDGSKFTNVTAENGRIISDGDRIIVVGCAFPGLTESLGLSDKEQIEIPEYFELSADVKDFEMKTTITAGSSNIFSDIDLGNISDTDELKSKIDELSNASDKLCSGTKELCSGLEEFKNGTDQLSDGADELAQGTEQLDTGINDLAVGAQKLDEGAKKLDDSTGILTNGISDARKGSDILLEGFNRAAFGTAQLKNGADSLAKGLVAADDGAKQVDTGAQQLADGAQQLADGAAQLSAGTDEVADGTSKLSDSAITLDNGADALADGVGNAKTGADKLSVGIEQAGAGAEQLADGIAQASEGVDRLSEGAQAGVTQIGQMSEQVAGAADSLDVTIGYNQQVIMGLTAMRDGYAPDSQEYQQLDTMINTLAQTVSGQQQISAGLKSGAEASLTGLTELTGGLTQLRTAFHGDATPENPGLVAGSSALSAAFNGDSDNVGLIVGSKELAGGIGQLQTGANTLAGGTQQLVDGTAALDTGAHQATAGAKTLLNSSVQLANGASALSDGTRGLSAGISSASSGASALYNGSVELEGGIVQLSDGTLALNGGLIKLDDGGRQLKTGTDTLSSSVTALSTGAEELRNGSGVLLDGAFTLRDGTNALSNGADRLLNGSKELDTGMNKFKKDGIDKIVKVYSDDLSPLFDRLGKLTELSRDYTSFSGAANGVDTEVKFIYETDAIK